MFSPSPYCAVALLPNVIRAALFVSMALNQAVLPLISPRIHVYPFRSCCTHCIDNSRFSQAGFSAIEQGVVPVDNSVDFVCEARALRSVSAGRVSFHFQQEYCSPVPLLSVHQVCWQTRSMFPR